MSKYVPPHSPAWGLYHNPLADEAWQRADSAQTLALQHIRNQIELGIEEWEVWAILLTDELGMSQSEAARALLTLALPEFFEFDAEMTFDERERHPVELLFPDASLGYIPSQHEPHYQWLEARLFIHWPSCGEVLTEMQRRSRRIQRLKAMRWRHDQAMARTLDALEHRRGMVGEPWTEDDRWQYELYLDELAYLDELGHAR